MMTTTDFQLHIDNIMENVNLSKTEVLKYAKVLGMFLKSGTMLTMKLNADTKTLLASKGPGRKRKH
jgi:hypothetical protein